MDIFDENGELVSHIGRDGKLKIVAESITYLVLTSEKSCNEGLIVEVNGLRCSGELAVFYGRQATNHHELEEGKLKLGQEVAMSGLKPQEIISLGVLSSCDVIDKGIKQRDTYRGNFFKRSV